MPTAKKSSASYEPVPQGTHLATIYSIVHMGTIENYKGDLVDSVRITFELPNETREFDGAMKPMVISNKYTLSTHEKSHLGKLLRAIKGTLSEDEVEAFEVNNLAGESCLISIKHKEKKDGSGSYAVIDSASPLMKGMEVPAQFNKTFILDYEGNWSEEEFEKLPDFLKDDMRKTDEYREATTGIAPEDIPFD